MVTHSAKTFALASLHHIVERSTHSFHIRFSAHVLADTAFSKEFESCGGEVQLFDALQSFLSVVRVLEKPAACKLPGSNFSVLAAAVRTAKPSASNGVRGGIALLKSGPKHQKVAAISN